MAMILEYDRSPNATLEQRLNTLSSSVQRALEAVESDVNSIANSMGLIGDDMESFVDLTFTEADETAPIESGQSLPELFGQIKKNERDIECETLSIGNIDMTITDAEFEELEALLPDISGGATD